VIRRKGKGQTVEAITKEKKKGAGSHTAKMEGELYIWAIKGKVKVSREKEETD